MPPQRTVLSRRIRILVTISILYALRKRVKARMIVQRVLAREELPPAFFAELFIHLSLFLGYPTMLDGLESIAEVSRGPVRRTLKTSGSSAHKQGRRILKRIYGPQTPKLLHHLDTLYPGLGHRITQDAYGLIMNRGGLSLQERELVNVVVLFCHGLQRQLYSHLRGAIRVGVSRNILRSVVLEAAEISGKSPRRTLGILSK
jgi:4-carboxymuconolactone decarboxylase